VQNCKPWQPQISPITFGKPLYKPSQLFAERGQQPLSAADSVRDRQKLQPNEFAVNGQLYSPTRGINFY